MQVERVASLADPRVADYRDVQDADLRGRDGLFMCEGRLGVRRLIEDSRFRPRSVFVTGAAFDALRDALERLPDDTPVYLAEQGMLNGVVGYNMHRGCLAVALRGADPEFEDLFSARTGRALLLEQLANPDNVGGVFRNAEAFGVDGVLLCPRCADPLYRKAVRVSMGGALRVPFARSDDWSRDLGRLRALGWTLVALDPRGDSLEIGELPRADVADRIAFLLGTEGKGLTAESLEAADLRVRIEMAPGVDSLNVATAAAIALHTVARSRSGATAISGIAARRSGRGAAR